MGAIRISLALGVIMAAMLFAGEHKRFLGPRDPIAADGSFKAGRALTISELSPSLEPAASDLDDPGKFEERFSGSSVERDRSAILDLAGLSGPVLCEPDRHQQLIAAIQNYYGTKRYLDAEFHFRGPRASQFIDEAWTTPKDRQIETFVRQLLEKGFLRAREIWPRDRSFLFDVIAQDLSPNACSRS
jgi:hypothetical protein